MYQAFNRQIAYANLHGAAAEDPTQMLTHDTREAVARSWVEPQSWGRRGGLNPDA